MMVYWLMVFDVIIGFQIFINRPRRRRDHPHCCGSETRVDDVPLLHCSLFLALLTQSAIVIPVHSFTSSSQPSPCPFSVHISLAYECWQLVRSDHVSEVAQFPSFHHLQQPFAPASAPPVWILLF